MKADEKDLLERVIGEQPGAFDEFLERYRALVYSVLYGKGFGFPSDYMDDIYQSFVVALTKDNYRKLRAFQGRNNCSLATFLQVVTTRFALDELRKWKRHPRGRGLAGMDDDELVVEVADPHGNTPLQENLESERIDLFHNLLFALEWKRISVVLWVFRGIARETVAEMMDTSRANIDALYKRAKDQMAAAFAEGDYSTERREEDPRVLTPEIQRLRRRLLGAPPQDLNRALLQPAVKQKAVIGLIMANYSHCKITLEELERLTLKDPTLPAAEQALADAASELGL